VTPTLEHAENRVAARAFAPWWRKPAWGEGWRHTEGSMHETKIALIGIVADFTIFFYGPKPITDPLKQAA